MPQIDPENLNVLAFGIAFSAGFMSFLSPCVLPLVPAYIGYLSGATVAEGKITEESRWTTFGHAVAFVAGFTALFVLFGAWLGLTKWALALVSGSEGTGLVNFDIVVGDVLIRVGSVLLAVMAVRVADSPLGGDWRLRVGDFLLEWPAKVGPLPQKYVRWLLVGLLTSVVYWWLAGGYPSPGVVLLDALMLMLIPLAGTNLSRSGALLLGLASAALNTAAWSASLIAEQLTAWIPALGARVWLTNPQTVAFGPVEWFGVLAQALLILLVVYFTSRTTLFYQEKRFEVSGLLRGKGHLTSAVMGAVFGAAWTPCTGPNLAIVIALAGSADTVLVGTTLLISYALGLGLPFLGVGLAFGAATTMLRRLTPYMGVIKAINTALLLFMAALILSGALQELSSLDFWESVPFS